MEVATSPDDEAFQQCLDGDDEYNFVAIKTPGSLEMELNKHIQGVTSYLQPSGQDSISTFYIPEEQSISNTTLDSNTTNYSEEDDSTINSNGTNSNNYVSSSSSFTSNTNSNISNFNYSSDNNSSTNTPTPSGQLAEESSDSSNRSKGKKMESNL